MSEKIVWEPYTKNRCMTEPRATTPVGIVVHSTAAKGTKHTRWGQGSPWDTETSSKAAHALIDTDGIWQTLPWDVRCWLAAGDANYTHIQFEICEPSKDTDENAKNLYEKTLYLCTELCKMYGIASWNVVCHSEAHKMGIANNHSDVTHWWGKKGTPWEPYTMDRLRADIAAALGEEKEEGVMYTAVVKTKYDGQINLWSNTKKSKSLAKLKDGTTVTIEEEVGAGWCKVSYNGMEGYCDGKYLVDRKPIEDADVDEPEENTPEMPDIIENETEDGKIIIDVTFKGLSPEQLDKVLEVLDLA